MDDPQERVIRFDLQTPKHLLHKLEWEYVQWQNDPLNTYRAWNFSVTAEHLPDWPARTGPRLPKGFSINENLDQKGSCSCGSRRRLCSVACRAPCITITISAPLLSFA
jgi:hypothetical protein